MKIGLALGLGIFITGWILAFAEYQNQRQVGIITFIMSIITFVLVISGIAYVLIWG